MQFSQEYIQLIHDIKTRIAAGRSIAARLVNQEQLKVYFGIGKLLNDKINTNKWGDKVLRQIADDLLLQMPGLRGFAYGSLKKMRQFYTSYAQEPIGPLLTGQLQAIDNLTNISQKAAVTKITPDHDFNYPSSTEQSGNPILYCFLGITFTHHLLLLNKCKSYEERLFYMQHAANEGWSVEILERHIRENLFKHFGKLHHNFNTTIQRDQGAVAKNLFKDQYLIDFLQLQEDDSERKMEESIVSHITEFILKMGKGFAFIGNQFRLEVEGQEFFIDLLFFNRILQRLVVFELKRDAFKPEYTGQLHFYLNILDDKVKMAHEHPSIGIILCKEKRNAIVQYSIRNMSSPMGVATYRNSTEPPKEIKEVFPTADQLKKLIK